MTSAQVVETPVNVPLNSPSQDYTHPDDRTPLSYDILFLLPYLIARAALFACIILVDWQKVISTIISLLSLPVQYRFP